MRKREPNPSPVEQVQQRGDRERGREHVGLLAVRVGAERRSWPPAACSDDPDAGEHTAESPTTRLDRALPRVDAAARERRGRDQPGADEPRDHAAPGLRRLERVAADDRADGEREGRPGGDREAEAEEQVEPAALGLEAGAPRARATSVAASATAVSTHEPELRQLVDAVQLAAG